MAKIKRFIEKTQASKKLFCLPWCFSAVFCMLTVFGIVYTNTFAAASTVTEGISKDIYPQGELAELFNFNSNYTTLQRETKLEELKGKTVEWSLPLYEISKIKKDKYKISIINADYVGCIVYITATTEDDVKLLHAMKTGDIINFRGTFTGETFLRSLVLDNAVLIKSKQEFQGTHSTMSNSSSEYAVVGGTFDCGFGTNFTCTMDNMNKKFPSEIHFSDKSIEKLFSGCEKNDICVVTAKLDINDNAYDILSSRPFVKVDNVMHTKDVKFLKCVLYEGGAAYIYLSDESEIPFGLFVGYEAYENLCPKLVKNENYMMQYKAQKYDDPDGNLIQEIYISNMK